MSIKEASKSGTSLDKDIRERMVPYIDLLEGSSVLELTPNMAYKYKGDLRGLLMENKVDPGLIDTTLLLNGIISHEYDGTITTFKLVDPEKYRRVIRLVKN